MTELSPAAYAIVAAAHQQGHTNRLGLAAALQAAADQASPERQVEDIDYVHQSYVNGMEDALAVLREIADELESNYDPEYRVVPAKRPSDKELLDLMPEIMRDEFSYASKVCSDATGGQIKPEIFQSSLEASALQYARALITQKGVNNHES